MLLAILFSFSFYSLCGFSIVLNIISMLAKNDAKTACSHLKTFRKYSLNSYETMIYMTSCSQLSDAFQAQKPTIILFYVFLSALLDSIVKLVWEALICNEFPFDFLFNIHRCDSTMSFHCFHIVYIYFLFGNSFVFFFHFILCAILFFLNTCLVSFKMSMIFVYIPNEYTHICVNWLQNCGFYVSVPR